MQDLITISSKGFRNRLLLGVVASIVLLFCWFAIKWQIASMLANLTPPYAPSSLPAADLAASLAPANPMARWLQGSVHQGDTIDFYEDAVRLAPSDYRWRIELGRAYEQIDRPEVAERQLKKAVELAPNYAAPRWHLGNFYLRQGRREDAFLELRRAADNNQTYREQVFSLAWDYFDKDATKVEELAAETADAKANLALFFAARGRASDALQMWNQLDEQDKSANPEIAKAISQGLFIQRSFPEALEFSRQLGVDAEARPESVTNPGFERLINSQDDSRFGWKINRNDPKFDTSTDSSVKHQGSRSLKIIFRNYLKPELYNIFQTVVVEPNQDYRLSFWVRTENLKSAGAPLLEIVNANDEKIIAASKPFKIGTNDWEEYSVDFKVRENCNGITIRTARQSCGDQCPLMGSIWYDDFELKKQ